MFYCYFERVAERGIWFFFIRMIGNQEQASKVSASIYIGHAGHPFIVSSRHLDLYLLILKDLKEVTWRNQF